MRRTINMVLAALAALALMAGCGNLLGSGGTADASDGIELTIGFPSAARAVGDLFSEDTDVAYLELDVVNEATGLFEEVEVFNNAGVWQATFRVMSAHYGEVSFNARAYYSWYDDFEDRWYDQLAYSGSVSVNVPGTNQVIIPMVTFYPTSFSISGLAAYAGSTASLLVFQPGTDLQAAIDEALANSGEPPASMIAQADEASIDEFGVMTGSFRDWSADSGQLYDLYVAFMGGDGAPIAMTILSGELQAPLASIAGAEHWDLAAPAVMEENYFEFPTTQFVVNNIDTGYDGLTGMLVVFNAGTDIAAALSYEGEGAPPGMVAAGMTGEFGEYGPVFPTVASGSFSGLMLTTDVLFGEGGGGGLPWWNPEPGLNYDVYVGLDIQDGPRHLLVGSDSDLMVVPMVLTPVTTVTVGPYIVDASTALSFDLPVSPDYNEPDDSSDSASYIGTDGIQDHTLTAGDVDWVYAYLYAGTEYTFSTSGPLSPSIETDTYIELYPGDGTAADETIPMMSNDNDPAGGTAYSVITFTPETEGYYYIKVMGSNEGSYEIMLSATVIP